MTKKERLEDIIQFYSNGKPTAFAKFLGVAPSTISTWISRNTFDYDTLFAKCEELNAEWLLTGKGEMLRSNSEQNNIIPASSTGVGIPLLPIDAWAGLFKGEQTVTLAECDHFIVPAFKNADFLIPVRGDSMVPRYYSVDLVACKHLPLSDIFFQWGKVYVLDTNQGALIKEVRQGSSAHTIKLVSENPKYEPFEIPRECIYNIAIVQGLIRSE